MRSTLRDLAVVAVVAGIALFMNLGGPRLWDRDEPRNAGCTAEMLARGDWVTPVFDDELRTHKPILLYWFMMTAYSAFGVSEFSARFWSAAMALGTACLTYGIGRRLFSAQVGRWAGIILATTLMFDVAGRAATPDSLLIFWSTAALFAFVLGTVPACEAQPEPASGRATPIRRGVAVGMYAAMGMAVLAKGPVGFLLPSAVIGMYLLIERLPSHPPHPGRSRVRDIMERLTRPFAPRHFLSTCWAMRPVTACMVLALVALPWYVAVGVRTEGQWIRGFLLDHNLGRATQSLEGHHGTFLFYPLALLVGFFPWSVFAAPTVLETVRGLRGSDRRARGLTFALCWLGVYIGAFSLAQTKLPSYITPCYPAAALLVAGFLVAWIRGQTMSAPYWPRAAIACLGLIGLIIAVAVPFAAARYVPGEEWLGLFGCIPMLTAVAAWGFARAAARRGAAVAFGLGAVCWAAALFGVGAARIDSHRTFDAFLAHAYCRSATPRIGTLGVLEPSWVFYTQRPMDHLFAPELTPGADRQTALLGPPRTHDWEFKPFQNVWQFLRGGTDRFVITCSGQLEQIGRLPPDVEVIARTAHFMRGDELMLLAPRSTLASRPTPGDTHSTRQ